MNREIHVRFWEGLGVRFQCTELKPPPPGRPGEDEAWSGPGHAARSALG